MNKQRQPASTLAAALACCQVIDLSKRIAPGEVTGPVGMGPRRYDLKYFTFPPGERMTEIHMENHISTHVEAPLHFLGPRYGRRGKDVSQLPLQLFFGEAVLVDLHCCGPGQQVLPEMLEKVGVAPHDIVLFGNGRQQGQDRPFLGRTVAEYLAELPAKMVGIDDSVFPENPTILLKDLTQYHLHDALLSREIPLIEGLVGLDRLPADRFVFFGVPAAMGGCDSFPIRAMAFIASG
jgi:kynurenine formamidase